MEPKKKNTKQKSDPEKAHPSKRYVAVLVRGLLGIRHDIKNTLYMLRLRRKHACVVVDATETNLGMLRKCQNYITFGEIDKETYEMLVKKRGKKDKLFYSLAPPRKGFERKGIKQPFTVGGALGYRGEKINELIKRMV
jgi:large subunit ribosomal protein L30